MDIMYSVNPKCCIGQPTETSAYAFMSYCRNNSRVFPFGLTCGNYEGGIPTNSQSILSSYFHSICTSWGQSSHVIVHTTGRERDSFIAAGDVNNVVSDRVLLIVGLHLLPHNNGMCTVDSLSNRNWWSCGIHTV